MGNVTQWEYVTHVISNPEIHKLDETLKFFGHGGWELLTMTSTIKFSNRAFGNELVLVFKRPTDEPADLSLRAPALFNDQGEPLKDPLKAGTPTEPLHPVEDDGYHGA